ncbi:MAG: hypothetical protein Q4E54_03155 [Lachnospiraceae bacterium]|nr:hypothetical protein [Lachnospiraceae bacterium]
MNNNPKFEINKYISKHMTASWEVDGTRYKNFTDLGDYVVLLGDYDESYDINDALKKLAVTMDIYVPNAGCTGTAKLNKDAEVLMAHNMDLDITQSPAYLYTTSFGKYKTFGVNYIGHDPQTYEQMKKDGKINEDFLLTIPMRATDVMNETGLYICDNMRMANDERLIVSGTNPGKTRACLLSVPQLVASECATVQEAVAFLNDSYDFYSLSMPVLDAYGWNLAFLVGDATGEFGLIEVAGNEFNYLPCCPGQANYYQTERWNIFDNSPAGYGRFALVQKYLNEPQDIDGMKQNMSRIYFTKCIADVPYAKRNEKGKVCFYDKDGNESLDWRSDYGGSLIKDDNGNYISASSENMPSYINNDLFAYISALLTNDRKAMAAFGDYGKELLNKALEMSAKWNVDDANFEILQKEVLEDNEATHKTENVEKWRAGDEKPLRDAENCWMSSLASGVNCKQKIMKMSFWEKMSEREVTFSW